MRKKFLFILILSSFLMSCKQTLSNADILTELENAIEWTNSVSFDVSVKAEEGTGTLGVPGVLSVRVKETAHLIFTLNSGFIFEGWHAVKKSDPTVFMDEYVSFDNALCAITDVTILKYDEDLMLVPFCTSKDSLLITFVSDGGIVTPVGSQRFYLNDEFSINFTANYGYSLRYWKIYETESKNNSNAVTVINENDIYKVKVLNTDVNITIEAVCALYPNVVYKTPESLTPDSPCEYQDENLRVLFDQPMSEDSIYYTSSELSALPQGCTKLESSYAKNADGTKKVYGYKLNGKTVWKNISIINKNDNTENLLSHYTEPRLLSDNILVIYVNRTSLPPKEKEILIQLSSRFCNKNNICLPENVEWTCYFDSTSKTDSTPPEVEKLVLSSKTSYGIENYDYCSNKSNYPSVQTVKDKLNNQNIKCLFLSENKLKIEGKVNDVQSGVKDLKMTYTPVCDKNEKLTGQPTNEISIPINNSGATATINTEIDLSSYFDSKYSYKITFELTDNAGKKDNSQIYYIAACYAPVVKNIDIKTVQKENGEEVSVRNCLANEKLKLKDYYRDHSKYSGEIYNTFPYSKSRKIRLSSEIQYEKGISTVTYTAQRKINEKQQEVTDAAIIIGTYNFNGKTTITENREIDMSSKSDGVYYIQMEVKDKTGESFTYDVGSVLLDKTPISFSSSVTTFKKDDNYINILGSRGVNYIFYFNFKDNNDLQSYENRFDMASVVPELSYYETGEKIPMNSTIAVNVWNDNNKGWRLSIMLNNTCFSEGDHYRINIKLYSEDCWGNRSSDYKIINVTGLGDGVKSHYNLFL